MHESGLYLNDWQGTDVEALKVSFGITDDDLQGVEILLASYSRDAFSGEAFVLFCRNHKLYEVNACHDSDGQLTGQWEPEETFIGALRFRMEEGRLGCSEQGQHLFVNELRFLLLELASDGIE